MAHYHNVKSRIIKEIAQHGQDVRYFWQPSMGDNTYENRRRTPAPKPYSLKQLDSDYKRHLGHVLVKGLDPLSKENINSLKGLSDDSTLEEICAALNLAPNSLVSRDALYSVAKWVVEQSTKLK